MFLQGTVWKANMNFLSHNWKTYLKAFYVTYNGLKQEIIWVSYGAHIDLKHVLKPKCQEMCRLAAPLENIFFKIGQLSDTALSHCSAISWWTIFDLKEQRFTLDNILSAQDNPSWTCQLMERVSFPPYVSMLYYLNKEIYWAVKKEIDILLFLRCT